MKRVYSIAAMVLCAVMMVACNKSDAGVEKVYKVDFSVSEKPSFATTRALKTAWVAGDQILVILHPESGSWLIAANDNSKTLKLIYDGTQWSASTPSVELMNELGASGSYYAVYYRGDVGIGADWDGYGDTFKFANYKGGEYYYYNGGYSVADDVLTLEQINMKKGSDIFQISVENLLSTAENQAKNWKLAILRDKTQQLPIPADMDDLVYYEGMAEGYFTFSSGKTTPYTIYYATSVQNDNDASFWFWHPFYNEGVVNDKTEARYLNGYYFTLTDGTSTWYYEVDRKLDTADEKTLNPETAYLLPELSAWTVRTHADVQWDRTEPLTPSSSEH